MVAALFVFGGQVVHGFALALIVGFDIAGFGLGQLHARFSGQPLHRFGKSQPLRLDEKREDVAVLAGGIVALLCAVLGLRAVWLAL